MWTRTIQGLFQNRTSTTIKFSRYGHGGQNVDQIFELVIAQRDIRDDGAHKKIS